MRASRSSTGSTRSVSVSGVPVKYAPLYQAAGKTCPEISAALLAAQGKQESGFRPNAVGPSHPKYGSAKGIAQFIDSTWKEWGQGGSVFNPEDAIPAQGRHMCALYQSMKKYPGDTLDNTLAAYNAGPGWVQYYNGVPPFPETIDYIALIKRNIK